MSNRWGHQCCPSWSVVWSVYLWFSLWSQITGESNHSYAHVQSAHTRALEGASQTKEKHKLIKAEWRGRGNLFFYFLILALAGLNWTDRTFLTFSGTGRWGWENRSGRGECFCHTWKTQLLVQLCATVCVRVCVCVFLYMVRTEYQNLHSPKKMVDG